MHGQTIALARRQLGDNIVIASITTARKGRIVIMPPKKRYGSLQYSLQGRGWNTEMAVFLGAAALQTWVTVMAHAEQPEI